MLSVPMYALIFKTTQRILIRFFYKDRVPADLILGIMLTIMMIYYILTLSKHLPFTYRLCIHSWYTKWQYYFLLRIL
jgi:hypothetical protein